MQLRFQRVTTITLALDHRHDHRPAASSSLQRHDNHYREQQQSKYLSYLDDRTIKGIYNNVILYIIMQTGELVHSACPLR